MESNCKVFERSFSNTKKWCDFANYVEVNNIVESPDCVYSSFH